MKFCSFSPDDKRGFWKSIDILSVWTQGDIPVDFSNFIK